MKRLFWSLVLVLPWIAIVPGSAFAAMSCADFRTQESAQRYFEAGGGAPGTNFDNLDEDGDGWACEDQFGEITQPYSGPRDGSKDTAAPTAALQTPIPTSVAPTPSPGASPAPARTPTPEVDDSAACTSYDAWIWAQSVFDADPKKHAAMDPDKDGIACEKVPIRGFAPLLTTKTIPSKAVEGSVTSIVDPQTVVVSIDGASRIIRLNETNAPNEKTCGYDSALDFLTFALSLAPNAQVFIEPAGSDTTSGSDVNGYVWFKIGDDVYMANELMVRAGMSDISQGSESRPHEKEIQAASIFAEKHAMGLRLECGGFERPLGSKPNSSMVTLAKKVQPNQGQFGPKPTQTPSSAPGQETQPSQPIESQPEQQQPVEEQPVRPVQPTQAPPRPVNPPATDPGQEVDPTPIKGD